MEEEEKREGKGAGRRRRYEGEVRRKRRIMVKGHVFIVFHFLFAEAKKTY